MKISHFGSFFLLAMSPFAQVAAGGHGVRKKKHNDEPSERSLQDVERVIIKYRDGYQNDVQSFMAQDGGMMTFSDGESVHSIPELGILVGQVTPSLKQELEGNELVERVEIDQPRQLYAPRNIRGVGRDLQETPYGVTRVQAPDLWSAGYRGSGVKVCVIDSGIDSGHPDFGNLEGENVFGVDWSQDSCGHGTHVSGTVAATGNQRVIGVAPEATILTVRFFGDDCGQIFSSDLIQGAISCRNNGAKIISMSLGGGSPTQSEEEAFNNLFNDNNILSIAAAGNSGNSGREYPASYPVVVSVAATDSSNNRASFSQINDQVDIAAPGVGVLSTMPRNNCVICSDIGSSDGYGQLDGTSMSCPHVSGVAALLFNAVPSASPQDVRNAMEQSALDLGPSGRDDEHGHGLVQASAALRVLQGDNSPTPGPPVQPPVQAPVQAPTPEPSASPSESDGDDFVGFDDDFELPFPTFAPIGFPTDDFFFPAPSPMANDDFDFGTWPPTPEWGEDDWWFPAPSPSVGTDDWFNNFETPTDGFGSLAPSIAPSSERTDDNENWNDDLWF